GADLALQKLTLPVIHALRQADAAQRRPILDLLENAAASSRVALRSRLEKLGSFDYARAAARKHAELAIAQLAGLEASAALEVLASLPRFVLSRSA
ncbi:MAG: hypothetical protein KDA41_22430, partial [Planctomycetales bacterium]|nr:hypothetical protein [Planctomycetales bacterium]